MPQISLDQIEKVMRPNFVWMKHHNRRFMTDPQLEGSQSVGIMIFITFAELFGHEKQSIIDYMGIDSGEYEEKKSMFPVEFAASPRLRGKISLCMNAIKFLNKNAAIPITQILNF